jgi:hypothetical protein
MGSSGEKSVDGVDYMKYQKIKNLVNSNQKFKFYD